MTLSEAFAAPVAAADVAAAPVVLEKKAQAGPRARARDTSVPRVTAAARVMWSDLRESWWLPATVPPVAKAWRGRWPDRDRVPGNSEVLYTAWAVYNHTVALPAVAILNLLVGALTPVVWTLAHPARLALAALITTLIAVAVAAA